MCGFSTCLIFLGEVHPEDVELHVYFSVLPVQQLGTAEVRASGTVSRPRGRDSDLQAVFT